MAKWGDPWSECAGSTPPFLACKSTGVDVRLSTGIEGIDTPTGRERVDRFKSGPTSKDVDIV